ncbi:MAG: HupE/UreJ family protein [Rhodobacteraceae bacterium]|nr:HupE/UreJ family protein [Paracoccaceae bacterium]
MAGNSPWGQARVIPHRRLSRCALITFVFSLLAFAALAHEIQPAVADLEIQDGQVEIAIDMTLEAPLAGIDLEGLEDTNDAANADRYDALRALDPEALEAAFIELWPRLRDQITLRAGDGDLAIELRGVDIPPVGNPELARMSQVRIGAALPPGDAAVIFGWDAALGALVVRQIGVEDGYTGYLTNGALSDPIAAAGGGALSGLSTFATYMKIGYEHIIPKGLDHILFVLGLFFLSLKLRPLLWQVTAFTVAHTVTLALGILGIVTLPASIVEPLIAASIVYVGIENVLSRGLTPWRPAVVFGFGLLHGLGFASVLGDIGLDPATFVIGLIGFNVGVELGQLSVIAIAFFGLAYWLRNASWYQSAVANPASIAISLVGAYWVVERTLL